MRFNTLDGLRGIAAVLILFHHLGPNSPLAVPAAYLTVDLFFALSGFVVSLAYDPRLRAGMGLGEFALLRLIRFYPMAFIGAAIGVALTGSYFQTLLLLPDPSGIDLAYPTLAPLFPSNVPMWTLACELLANLAFALVIVRSGWRALGAILVASGAILTYGILHYQLSQLGAFWATIGYGLARTAFAFALGVTLHRVHQRFAVRRRETQLAWLIPAALLIIVTQLPETPIVSLAGVFVLMPLVLWFGTIWEAPQPRLFEELGGISYPLYCIHGVIIQASNALGFATGYLWIPLIAVGWWLNARIDVPLRGRFLAAMKRRRAALAPA